MILIMLQPIASLFFKIKVKCGFNIHHINEFRVFPGIKKQDPAHLPLIVQVNKCPAFICFEKKQPTGA